MDVAALLRSPTPSATLNELEANGFIMLRDRNVPQSSSHHVVQLTDELRAAVNTMWGNRCGSRYRNVRVLMVHWATDDLGVIQEIKMLGSVFSDLYRFDVSVYAIPSQQPDCALKRRVIEFVENACPDALLIFYYAGHAFLNPNRHDAPVWTANRRRDSPTLPSGGIRSLLEEADCDALLLYDSCHSADAAVMIGRSTRGVTEIIAACGFEGIAAEVGEHSFTQALVDILAVLSDGPPFSIAELHHRVLAQLQMWKPSPMQDAEGRFIRDQAGRLQMQPQRRRTPVHCVSNSDSTKRSIMLSPIRPFEAVERRNPIQQALSEFSEMVNQSPEILITVRMESGDPKGTTKPDTKLWLEWLRNAPPEAKEVEISVQEACINVDYSYETGGESLTMDKEKGIESTQQHEPRNESASQEVPMQNGPLPWILGGAPKPQNVGSCSVYPKLQSLGPWLRNGIEFDPRGLPPKSEPNLPWEPAMMAVQFSNSESSGWASSRQRGPWSQEEDAYLLQLVHAQGALNWVRIAQLIGSRSPKQCRERYHQNLKPSLNHEPISREEGLQIERLVGELGNRWDEVARRLHGRSANAIKNWWNGSMNRRRRLVLHRRSSHPPSMCSRGPHDPTSLKREVGVRQLLVNFEGMITDQRLGLPGVLPR